MAGQRNSTFPNKSSSSSADTDSHSSTNHSGSHGSEIFRTWCPHFQFQSHDPDFDYLKSVEIEEKINQIKFLPQINNNLFILSTNGTLMDFMSIAMFYLRINDDVRFHTSTIALLYANIYVYSLHFSYIFRR